MAMVRFAMTCDAPGCKARSEEYSCWPTCLVCGDDFCLTHLRPGTLREDEGRSFGICVTCDPEDA